MKISFVYSCSGEVSAGNMEASLLEDVYTVANADSAACYNENQASTPKASYKVENILNSPARHSSWK